MGQIGLLGFTFEYGTTWTVWSIPLEDCGLIYYVPLYLFSGNLLIIILLNHLRFPILSTVTYHFTLIEGRSQHMMKCLLTSFAHGHICFRVPGGACHIDDMMI